MDCTAPKRDKRNGCPKCEYTIKRKLFEAETKALLKKQAVSREEEGRWPFEYLLGQLNVVSRAHSRKRNGYDPKWTVTVSALVDIYRDEVAKMRAVDNWNHLQELRALANKGGGDDGDDGE